MATVPTNASPPPAPPRDRRPAAHGVPGGAGAGEAGGGAGDGGVAGPGGSGDAGGTGGSRKTGAASLPRSFRPDYLAGLAAGAPILMGLVPFGLIFGAAAKDAGLSWPQTQAMSLGIFAGSAQLVFLNLWNEGVNALALALTVCAVNLRLVIYGSSLAPHLGPPGSAIAGMARGYFLTDESYAISMANFLKDGFSRNPAWFFLGSAAPTWTGWQIMTATGWLAGSLLPEGLPFAMAIPMVFLALFISVLRSSARRRLSKIAAALGAGAGVALFRDAPLNLGLILAILAGVAAGILASRADRDAGEGR